MFCAFKYIFLLVVLKLCTCYEYFLSNISGQVENGNFVYYSMQYEGTILLELTSMAGDCDLYVSQKTKKPSYEPELNCMSSTTCGIDSLIIPKSFKRPVGIGIFSHPSHDICAYNLMFYKIDDSQDIFNYDPYQDSFKGEMYTQKGNIEPDVSEQESFLLVFLKAVVSFLIEILL